MASRATVARLTQRPNRQHGVTKRAALEIAFWFFILVLSAGDDLQRDQRSRRDRCLSHGLMRHFPIRKVGDPIAIARLPRCLEPPAAKLGSISNPSTAHRVSPLLGTARLTEAPPPITSSAKKKLNTAPAAIGDAIGL